ncbi:MAG: hypothetical protein WAZ18_01425 [Alphaproteobacteria bacterium]
MNKPAPSSALTPVATTKSKRTIGLPNDLRAELEAYADGKNISQARVIEKAVELYLAIQRLQHEQGAIQGFVVDKGNGKTETVKVFPIR